jgi:hypothetical protein
VDSPAARSRTQAELLPQLIALLEASGGKQIGIPVAICLSMVDKLAAPERDRALADARTLLSELLGESVTRWFEALCPEHRYFAISSAGLAPGAVDPINVSEVLDWVVSRGRVRKAVQTTELGRAKPSTFAMRAGVLAFAGLAGFGTYSVLHRAPRATTNSGEVTARVDTAVRIAPAPVVRPQASARSTESAQPNDSAGAVEAFRRLARASGAELTRWADTARARASRVLDSGPAGSRVLAPMHYIRARACGVPMMHCDRHQVIDDYSWVRVHGTLAQREEARRALDTLVVRRRHAAR